MRGRKPAPLETRAPAGTRDETRHRRMPEPVLVGGRPHLHEFSEPPAHLPKDAKAFWRDSVARLNEVGIIDRVDVPVLEQLAVQYARIRSAQRIIQDVGMFARGSAGQIREHPAMKIEREATAMFLKIAEHYALTPIARTRLGLAELHRRSLSQELSEGLGKPNLRKVKPTMTSEDPDEIDQVIDGDAVPA